MKAIILAAGRGSRLLPLTETRPKCLLPVAGTTVLGLQLDTLEAGGIDEAVVVTGFMAGLVEAEVAARTGPMCWPVRPSRSR
jgi:NDP-sugar pyrophosphorylase family protein